MTALTDRELLELAAKAAGMALEGDWESGAVWHWNEAGCMFTHHGHEWAPLTNDAHALRLAVKLRMLVDPDGAVYAVATATPKGAGLMAHEKHRDDPYAATRRAIVRAAAAIGQAQAASGVDAGAAGAQQTGEAP